MKLHDKILPTKSSYETDTFMNLKCKKKKIHHWHQHCTWLGHWSDDCFAQSNNPNPRHDSPIMTLVKYTKQTLVNKNNGNSKYIIKMRKINQCLPNSRSGLCRLEPHHGPQLC